LKIGLFWMASTFQSKHRPFLQPFLGNPVSPPPIWLMRQAGRYLPEYRAVRAKAGSFLELCLTPDLAAEVTLQPIRRFGFDAAILFSDILVVPDALGQWVEFVEGEGPRLDPIRNERDLARLNERATRPKFARICETVARVRQDLPNETALIGFCGAPWTIATYMVEGQGSADQREARLWAYRERASFAKLIDALVEVSADYLAMQIEAGADAVQIFDTWAGSLPPREFEAWVVAPTRRIVQAVRTRHPHAPIIGFPRGAGQKIESYAIQTGVQGIGCDTTMDVEHMGELARARKVVVQGNLDPVVLVAGGQELEWQVNVLLRWLNGVPHIFNLGHGILPETPPENVSRLVNLVRRYVSS
jgi:uroporphyrinogen decarboxylase